MAKTTLKTLEKLALSYEEISTKEKNLSAQKDSIKENIKKVLTELGIESVDVDSNSASPLRVQTFIKRKIIYDEFKLKKLVKSKGKDAFRTAFKIMLNESGLDDLFADGIIDAKEVKSCIDHIDKSLPILSIKRVKADIKTKAKEK